ncbi:MAG: sigma-70 family RNA polymerase sigma factor [Planctomycetota bacterium]
MSHDFASTVSLVRDAQGGSSDALDQLFERYLPRVRQIVALRLGYRLRDLATHEDIVQESLLKTFQSLDGFEQRSEGSFRSWLASCVVSSANDYFRRARAEKRGGGKVRAFSSYQGEDITTILFQGNDPTPSAEVGKKEALERVEQVLIDLKEHHREVIVLRLFCEMSYEEIGKEIGIAEEPTVRKLFSRAMAELRKRCEE